MDETRAQVYWQLINALLTCPSGKEPEILNEANSELLDQGFLQACEVVATMLVELGKETRAHFFRNLARELGESLGINDKRNTDNYEGENSENYREFILDLLQAEEESNKDFTVIYSMLARHKHLLTARFADVLQQVAQNLITEHPEEIGFIVGLIENLSGHINKAPIGKKANNIEIAITGYQIALSNREPGSEKFAITQNNLGNAYRKRIKGSRAENQERAIGCYDAALTVPNLEDFREKWADTQNNLAIAYSDRINGSRADNLERAIGFFEAALTVYTLENLPEDWAMIQNNLAIAYSNRINGSRADNLERAIGFCEAALKVYTLEDLPEKWATTQNSLGIAYSNRIKGSQADNLERAIDCYEKTLIVRTLEDLPEKWAGTQNNLAIAYSNRIKGSRAENLERAIGFCEAALKVYTLEDFREQWATTQNSLGMAYLYRINGLRADNLERAIDCYEATLTVRTLEDFPEKWADTQNNLAAAYSNRIKGSRADNRERAIGFYEAALTVRTLEDFPEQWADTQNNLANAYSDRINGSRADNLERAIDCYEATLTVRTLEDFREKWALTQNDLGMAYSNRIKGSRADNLERAIDCYERALIVRTLEDFPEDWAGTQNNLAAAYSNRIKGSRADNLERAIDCYERALIVRTLEDFPEDWAGTQNNLAVAYSDRIKGSRADNLERAIDFHKKALKVRTLEDFPENWAMTQNNLASAYINRIKEEKAENIEIAIAFCTAALEEVYTREAFPENWAMTQNTLALAYCNRIRGEKAENIEIAIAFYTASLEVYTREAFPEDWAMIQSYLATAYFNRIRGEVKNIEITIAFYTASLEVYTREAFPQYHAVTLFTLGLAYLVVPNLQLAYNTFAAAIDTVEFLRGEIHSGDESKQKLAEEWNNLYLRMVEVCVKRKNYTKAIEYVERSKARNLVELLATRDLYPKGDIPETVINELSRLRRAIDTEERRVEIQQTNRNNNGGTISGERSLQIDSLQTTSRDSTNLTQLRQQLDELLVRDIQPIDPDFLLTQKVKNISYSDIQALTAENTAILQWYILGDKFLTFTITPQSPTPTVWQSSTADFEALVNWDNEYQKNYKESKPQWKQKLASRLQNLAEILHLDRILKNIPKPCDRLILIPHRFLHLFPLHALSVSQETWLQFNPNSDSSPPNPYLLDCFPGGVSYAPSCQLLQQAKQRQRPNFSHLFAIANPTKDRYLLELQAANIRHKFKSNDFLAKDDANKNAILKAKLSFANCAHFGCHGKFEPDSPLESSLVFANKERLTLLEIFNLDLNQCRIVTLSACETGLTESRTSDEYIGLPFGFLLAGSPSMVSTLWKVDELASTLLLIRFYENLETLSTVTALNEAQQWLRNLTSEGLETLLKCLKPQIDQTFKLLPKKERTRFVNAPLDGALNRKPFPFAEPHYWAGFTAIGV
ncbi:CHAT domain-containing protein [Microcoleus sp. S13_B4]|uniref:CHAT domain-containing protein n=1 Tax=Microcoleus sp. S13_B4 TaxID=3055408 RepID=UPI002FD39E68